jgi:competence protein ComEC
MFNRKLKYGIILFLLVLVLISGIVIRQSKNQDLKVIFLDVGQGDSILISQGSRQILIDGGPSGSVLLSKLGKYIPFWDRKIELIVITHPDQDHIQGFIDVLKHYQVEKIIKTKSGSQSQTFKTLEDLIAQEKAEVIDGIRGTSIKIAEGVKGEIVYPPEIKVGDDSNENSVVIKLDTGKEKFLFTGDLPSINGEDKLLGSGIDLDADYLKIAHHGSKYSTSLDFLEKIKPKELIISVGKDNRYGHPNQETIDRLKKENIPILRTDQKGDIVFDCPVGRTCFQVI